jgi:phospholipase C
MKSARRLVFAPLLVSAALALSGCGSGVSQSATIPSFGGRFANHSGGSTPIQHIIIIMQENRSFNNLFYGFPGARTAKFGNGHGTKYTVEKVDLAYYFDLNHSHSQFLEDYDQGKDDGWDGEILPQPGKNPKCQGKDNNPYYQNEPSCWVISKNPVDKQRAFSYVDHTEITPYWTMAKEYALGDEAFSSNNGPTFVSHQYLVAGQSGHSVEVPNGQPWGCNASGVSVNLLAYGQADPPVFSPATGHEVAGPHPCFSYPTIASALDGAGLTWRYYAQKADSGRDLEPFQANKPIWDGPDHANIISPDTKVLADITSGNLANVSWVTPSGLKSDHPGRQSGDGGPDWVASIVNAVGNSNYWDSTAVIIMWDEWGGWFDPVHPPQLPDPQTGAREGLGFRVPLIVVSPYAKAGYISHDQHEIASTLRFIEETFGLATIGPCTDKKTQYADCRADGFDDMFDYTQSPIPFVTIPPVKHGTRYFLNLHDNTPGDTY